MLSKFNFKGKPSTHRVSLSEFSDKSTIREMQQALSYSYCSNLVENIPGHFVEFGVSSGVSFKYFARILEVYNLQVAKAFSRKQIYGFDSFEGLPELASIDLTTDGARKNKDMRKGGYSIGTEMAGLLSFVEKHKDAHLVKGWYDESVPAFFEENPHIILSLIHIDCDLYSSTKTALQYAVKHLAPGGIILFDELFHPDFPGETQAFKEELLADIHLAKYTIEKCPVFPSKWIVRST